MLGHGHVNQQVAGNAAAHAGVALRGDAHPRTVGSRRRNADGQGLRSRFHALATARRAFLLLQPSCTTAGRAGLRKHHVAADRAHRARAFARHAACFRDAMKAAAGARSAGVLPRDGDRPLHAVPRFFETSTASGHECRRRAPRLPPAAPPAATAPLRTSHQTSSSARRAPGSKNQSRQSQTFPTRRRRRSTAGRRHSGGGDPDPSTFHRRRAPGESERPPRGRPG